MKISLTQEMKNKALQFAKNAAMPICVGDVAKHLGVTWATARQIVMLLALEKEIVLQKTTKSWILKAADSPKLKTKIGNQIYGGEKSQ